MAILYKKPISFGGAGKFDNITYLMQNTNKGSKRRTPEEMQALADEQNRLYSKMRNEKGGGVQTVVKVFPEGEDFNRKHLDPTDNVISIGDREAQEKFFLKKFPNQSAAALGWSDQLGTTGTGKRMTKYSQGQWGVVDNTAAEQYYANLGKQNTNSPEKIMSLLSLHEGGHNWVNPFRSDAHTTKGIMRSGQEMGEDMMFGTSIDEIADPKENALFMEHIIKNRQGGDPKRLAVDNYAKNKAKYDAAQLQTQTAMQERLDPNAKNKKVTPGFKYYKP